MFTKQTRRKNYVSRSESREDAVDVIDRKQARRARRIVRARARVYFLPRASRLNFNLKLHSTCLCASVARAATAVVAVSICNPLLLYLRCVRRTQIILRCKRAIRGATQLRPPLLRPARVLLVSPKSFPSHLHLASFPSRALTPLKATCQLIPTSPVRSAYFEQLETR